MYERPVARNLFDVYDFVCDTHKNQVSGLLGTCREKEEPLGSLLNASMLLELSGHWRCDGFKSYKQYIMHCETLGF